jgi:hypothetical protein
LSGIIVGSILTFLIRIKRQRRAKVSTLTEQREQDTVVK